MEAIMCRKLLCLLLAAPALILANATRADPNVEYGEQYETAYLAACSAGRSLAACQCSMEAIEDTISFHAFATLIEQYGGDIRRAVPADRVDPVLERRCGIASLSVPVQSDVAQRTPQ
jgi:hypothetical protein